MAPQSRHGFVASSLGLGNNTVHRDLSYTAKIWRHSVVCMIGTTYMREEERGVPLAVVATLGSTLTTLDEVA